MSRKKPGAQKAPLLPPDLLLCEDAAALAHLQEQEGFDLSGIHLRGLSLTADVLHGMGLDGALLERCTLAGPWEKASFFNTVFQDCELSAGNFSGGWFTQCAFERCKGVGANFAESRLRHVLLKDCHFRYANFTSSQLDACTAEDTDLSEAFFAECKLADCLLHRAKLTRAEFFHTPLHGLDFRDSNIEGLCVSAEGRELAGAVVSYDQAASLARLLGLEIRE